MRNLSIVNTIFVHEGSLRRKHEFTIMQAERNPSTQMVQLHIKILEHLQEWSRVDGPNDKLENAIKDIVFSALTWRKLVTRHIYFTWRQFQPSTEDPIPPNYDELDWWLNLAKRYGPPFGTTALQCIDRAVEQFRKNKVSLVDGIELLCRMRGFTCYMFLLLDLCLEHSGEFNVRHCLSAISNYQLEEL